MDNSSKWVIAGGAAVFGALILYAELKPVYELTPEYHGKATVERKKHIPMSLDSMGPAGGNITPEQYKITFLFDEGFSCTFYGKAKDKELYGSVREGDKMKVHYQLLKNKDKNDVKDCLVSRILK